MQNATMHDALPCANIQNEDSPVTDLWEIRDVRHGLRTRMFRIFQRQTLSVKNIAERFPIGDHNKLIIQLEFTYETLDHRNI